MAHSPGQGASGTSETEGPLRPFRGSFGSGIGFASGRGFWLFRFGSTPTRFGAYDGIWAITPEGRRVLYADPAGVERVASTYHEFDRAVGASIAWNRMDENAVELRVEGDDGRTVDVRARLGSSIGARLLNVAIALTPRSVLRTSFGAALCNASLSRVVDANGLKAVGLTETAEPYRFEADWVRTVDAAEATVNGEDLGEPRAPERPIAFGDVTTPNEPFFAGGDLFLRPPPSLPASRSAPVR